MKYRLAHFVFACIGVVVCQTAVAELCVDPKDTYDDYNEHVPRKEIKDLKSEYYVLSYTWAPDFCAHKAKPDSKRPGQRNYLQCASDYQFGYVLHGLWPQGSQRNPGNYPRACEGDYKHEIPRSVLNKYLCMTPSVWLLQHEYEYHGTCMHDESLETPEAYFDKAFELHSQLTLPTKKLKNNPSGIEWWLNNNPHLVKGAIQYAQGLNEWQFCYDNNFNVMTCPGAADQSSVAEEHCEIKGNISRSGNRYYFMPDHPDYAKVKIDTAKGERCFDSEQAAKAAGWRHVP